MLPFQCEKRFFEVTCPRGEVLAGFRGWSFASDRSQCHLCERGLRAVHVASIAYQVEDVCEEAVEVKRRAKEAVVSGRLDSAYLLLQEGISKHPEDRRLVCSLASVLGKLGAVDAALQRLHGAYDGIHYDYYYLVTAASLEAKRKNYQEARALFERATKGRIVGSAHLYQSWALMEADAENHRDAVKLLRKGVRQDPNHAPLHQAWARIEASMGHTKNARRHFQQAHELNPQHVPHIHEWAAFELDQDQMDKARQLLETALKQDPQHLPSWMLLGKLEWLCENTTAFRGVYERAVENVGYDGKLLNSWAQLELQLHNHKKAKEIFSLVRAYDPGHIHSLQCSAQMEHRLGNKEKSRELYQMVLHMDPNNAAALHGLGVWLQKEGELDQAIEKYRQLLKVDPSNGHACHTLGIIAQSEGDISRARELFTSGLKSKDNKGALLNYEALAELEAFSRHPSEAVAVFEKGLRRHRATGRYLRQFALLLKKLGRDEEAALYFRRAAKRNPADYKTWLAWAVFEKRRRNFQLAELCFKKGIKVAPHNPHLWYAYVVMLWSSGALDAARKVFESACRHCPRNAPLWMEWALFEWEQGSTQRARELFEEGSKVPASYQHPPMYDAWARLEEELGNHMEAERLKRCAQEMYTLAARKG